MVSPAPVRMKIPLWKLVGGAAVHFVVPSYLLALGVDGWHFAVGHGGDAAAWLAHVPGISLRFLGAYAALGAGATGLAALAGRSGPEAASIAQNTLQAATHLREALAQGRGHFGAEADAALERIAALRLDPAEGAVAAMARDLAGMVAAGRAALNSGDDAEVRAMTRRAIERIEGEMAAHAAQGDEHARDRARIMAGYIGQRYGKDEI